MRRRTAPIFLFIVIAVAAATPGIGGPATGTPTGTRLTGCIQNDAQEAVRRLRAQGWGYGEIAMAFYLAQQSNTPVDKIVAMRAEGMGWGQIVRALGLPASELGKAQKALRSCGKQGKGPSSAGQQGKGQAKHKGSKGSSKGR